MWARRPRCRGRVFAASPPVVTERLLIRSVVPPDMEAVVAALRSEPPHRVQWGDAFLALMRRLVELGSGSTGMKVICERGSSSIVGLLWERSVDQVATDRVHLVFWTASDYDDDGYFEEVLVGYVPSLHGRGFRSVCCEVFADLVHERRMLESAGFEHVDTVRREKPDGSPTVAAVYEHRDCAPGQSV